MVVGHPVEVERSGDHRQVAVQDDRPVRTRKVEVRVAAEQHRIGDLPVLDRVEHVGGGAIGCCLRRRATGPCRFTKPTGTPASARIAAVALPWPSS